MTNRPKFPIRAMAVIVWLVATQSRPMLSQGTGQPLSQLLPQLSSVVVRERAAAALQIIASPDLMKDAAIVAALVDLLERENRVIVDSYQRGIGVSRELGEGYSEYYSQLLSTLGRPELLRDERTLRVVAEGSYNPDSKLAEIIADAGGARVLPTAVALTTSGLVGQRWSGLAILARVYERRDAHRLPRDVAEAIKAPIMGATAEPSTRRLAVELLGRIGTRDDLRILREIASSDPESRMHDTKGRIFPIRELAADVIKSIEGRHPAERPAANTRPQVDQDGLALQLLGQNAGERARALDFAQGLGAANTGPALRAALIIALERDGELHRRRYEADQRGEPLSEMDNPTFLPRAAFVVARLRDPRAIPGLAGALGSGSGSIDGLAEFGEQAAPVVLNIVTSPTSRVDAVNGGLMTLRRMVEGSTTRPLTVDTRAQIRRAAEQRLATGKGLQLTPMWNAIRLAVALDDPGLRQIVQSIASDRNELIRRGVTDTRGIAETQKKAAEALAATPARPGGVR